LIKPVAVAAIAAGLTLFAAPTASAQGDPHIPNGKAGWCPGGDHRERISGGSRYCLGVPYPDGSFYAQSWAREPYKWLDPGFWGNSATCSFMVGGLVQGGKPYSTDLPKCGGGPHLLNV
jgi:hypothetical protein